MASTASWPPPSEVTQYMNSQKNLQVKQAYVTNTNRFSPYSERPFKSRDLSTRNVPSEIVSKPKVKKSEHTVTFEFTVERYYESDIKLSTKILKFNEDYIGFEVFFYKGKRYTDYDRAKEKLLSLEGTNEEDIDRALQFYCQIYTEKNIGNGDDIMKFQSYLSSIHFKLLNFSHFIKMFKFILLYCRGNGSNIQLTSD